MKKIKPDSRSQFRPLRTHKQPGAVRARSNAPYEDPALTKSGAEQSSITHLCSYASSHTTRSTIRKRQVD